MKSVKIRIQSKSGDLNVDRVELLVGSLGEALAHLRKVGAYEAEYRGDKVIVPFEEIRYIEPAESDSYETQGQ